jgi:hypothetical protein
MPTSRKLNSEEEAELEHLLLLGLELVPLPEALVDLDARDPALLVLGISAMMDAVRAGAPLPDGMALEDLSTCLGVLLGEELCRCSGWSWAYLVFEDGFEGLAVSDSRQGLAMLPIHYVYGLLMDPAADNTLSMLFSMIRQNETPEVDPGAWRILG